MADSDDEARLIERIRAGDCNAFRLLVESHQDRVFRMCSHTLGAEDQARDLAQDTFVTAYRKLDKFNPAKGSFSTWLLTIARRLSINTRKKLLRFPANSERDLAEGDGETPDQQLSRAEVYQALDKALAELSDNHRRAFVMAEIEELSFDQIASIEGIANGTVKSRVSRAKAKLKGHLKSTFNELKQSSS